MGYIQPTNIIEYGVIFSGKYQFLLAEFTLLWKYRSCSSNLFWSYNYLAHREPGPCKITCLHHDFPIVTWCRANSIFFDR